MNNDPRKDKPFSSAEEQLKSRVSSASNVASSAAQNIGNRTADVASSLGEKASDLVEQMSTTMDTARQKFNDTRDIVVDKTKVAAKATDEYVVNNPWKAVGIASGIALVLGMMMRRR